MSIDHGKVLALLKIAVCPNKENGCDGEQYPVDDPAGDFHGEQCQWCAERREAMAAEIDRLAEAADGESIESPQSHAYYNAVRALAQPAEAVEGSCKWSRERIDGIAARLRASGDEEAATLIELQCEAGIAAEQELLDTTHDAAQGDGKEWIAGYMQGANDYVGGTQGALDQDELRADAEMAQRHYDAELAAAPSQEGES